MSQTRSRSRMVAGLVLTVALVVSGCGDNGAENQVHVQGTVLYDGNPLPMGMIVFEPDPSKGNSGPQGHAEIKNGRFDTRAAGKAAVTGAQIVRITGGDGVNPEPFTPFGNLLFDEHTVRVELSKDQPDRTFDIPRAKKAK